MSESGVRVGAVMTWTADGAGSALLKIRVADAPDQRILDEELVPDGAQVEQGPVLAGGARPVRVHAPGGHIALRYAAGVTVRDGGDRVAHRDDAPLPRAPELDFALGEWTLPSRYCPSDALGPTAAAAFGGRPRTRRLIPEVADWVRERIAYVPGASDSLTTADQTLLARQGVCRDMAHLTASLLRALDVPARLVAAYAPALEPPDFHAVVEAHDGVAWRIVDATGLAPVETLVRIATGRDAADIAWASADGALRLDAVEVAAQESGEV
jgi:transglutaminase-like putative cysteine protease